MKSFNFFFKRGKNPVSRNVQGTDLNDATKKLRNSSLNENIVITKIVDNLTREVIFKE